VKNKILEAMAANVPIVATPISLSGTPLLSGRHLLVAEKPAEIAEAVTRIFRQPDLAASLAKAALAELHTRYTWERVADQFDAVYSSLKS
jgi:glycosyltransferase involved in cell wall biosynthesis